MGPPTDREVSFITTVGSLGRWRSEMKRRLIDIEEAAHYLGLKKSTLYSWAWSRKIPSVKMGRRLLFDLKDLDEMIELQKREVSDTLAHALSDFTPS